MRLLMTLTVLSVLSFAIPVQSQSPRAQQGQQEQSAPKPKRVEIIEFKDLPKNAQSQVDAIVASMPQEDVQKLRQSVEALPEASEALKAKGVNSSHVVVATVNDEGTLILITKSAT